MNLYGFDVVSVGVGAAIVLIPIVVYIILGKLFRPKPKAPRIIADEILKANKMLVDAFTIQNKVNQWMHSWFNELEGGKANG